MRRDAGRHRRNAAATDKAAEQRARDARRGARRAGRK
jgi:hypothetical protein